MDRRNTLKSLRRARTEAGYTIADASKKLGVTPQTLSNYERGISFPDVRIIKKIESLYNIAFKDIFFEL